MVAIASASTKRGIMMISAPQRTANSITQVSAKTWKNGSAARMRSRPGSVVWNHATACAALADRLAWLSMAPFGVPDVPPVYCSTARSVSGSMATAAGFVRVASRSGSQTCFASRGGRTRSRRFSTRIASPFARGSIGANGQTTIRPISPASSSRAAFGYSEARSSVAMAAISASCACTRNSWSE